MPLYLMEGWLRQRKTILTISLKDNPLNSNHNRMPVILKPSEYERWLKDDRVPVDLLRPYDAESMASRARCLHINTPVSNRSKG
jgi:putative SOS response-associated peptidase YedK